MRVLNLIDEHSRECLLVRAERRWSSAKVIDAFADVMVMKGVPGHLRSDEGPEFVRVICASGWPTRARRCCTSSPAPRGNGYCESFNSKLRDEFLNGGDLLLDDGDQAAAERWRVHYNTVRPHSSLGYRPPAPEIWASTSLGGGNRFAHPASPTPHKATI